MKLPSDDVHLEIEQEELLNDSRANPRYDASNSRSPPMEKICIYSLAVVIGLTLVFLMVPSNTAQTNDSPMEYTCPSSITKKSLNDVGDNMEWYISDDKKHKNDSIQELVSSNVGCFQNAPSLPNLNLFLINHIRNKAKWTAGE